MCQAVSQQPASLKHTHNEYDLQAIALETR